MDELMFLKWLGLPERKPLTWQQNAAREIEELLARTLEKNRDYFCKNGTGWLSGVSANDIADIITNCEIPEIRDRRSLVNDMIQGTKQENKMKTVSAVSKYSECKRCGRAHYPAAVCSSINILKHENKKLRQTIKELKTELRQSNSQSSVQKLNKNAK